jgi:hypothetical protein
MTTGVARAGLLALTLALAALAGCGVKALPRPPLGPHPAAPPAPATSSPAPATEPAHPPQGCPECAAPESAPDSGK